MCYDWCDERCPCNLAFQRHNRYRRSDALGMQIETAPPSAPALGSPPWSCLFKLIQTWQTLHVVPPLGPNTQLFIKMQWFFPLLLHCSCCPWELHQTFEWAHACIHLPSLKELQSKIASFSNASWRPPFPTEMTDRPDIIQLKQVHTSFCCQNSYLWHSNISRFFITDVPDVRHCGLPGYVSWRHLSWVTITTWRSSRHGIHSRWIALLSLNTKLLISLSSDKSFESILFITKIISD